LNVLDLQPVEDVASRLSTDAVLFEKDWYVVRALGILGAFDHGEVTPVFSGGTSLSKGWGLIKRFSEDIDFKLAMPTSGIGSKDRSRRKAYRNRVLAALTTAELKLVGDVLKGNEDNFFAANFGFPSLFAAGRGLRPHLRVEMTFQQSTLPPVARPIQSLIGIAASDVFPTLVRRIMAVDTARGGGKAPANVAEHVALMLDRLRREKFWADEYDE
jgi:hypothetical protein